MNKHTQGSWRVGDGGATIFGPQSDQPAPVTIASLLPPTPRVSYEERKANAALIAAAPDLLAALEMILNDYDDTGCNHCGVVSQAMIEHARRVIRNAGGAQ